MTSIPRVDRRTLSYEVSATSADGSPVALTDIRLAVLAVGAHPGRDTAWATVPIVDGVAELIVAGPEARDDVAAHRRLAVGEHIVWYQLANGDDTITDDIERLSVN